MGPHLEDRTSFSRSPTDLLPLRAAADVAAVVRVVLPGALLVAALLAVTAHGHSSLMRDRY
ncbi:hypothetical protein [Ktedonospora formicarum]|uniref:Uncharacterized protein n=1 Tax=Ktedonospora formicarum TaxID=2778364 RepID=A0A8J3I3H5_9CHLR|nr:hypothetical protein [Ktedonospora formicarum]GHO49472.1 hypothetical protein KSX_76350 [Ktedonospora formicarum]